MQGDAKMIGKKRKSVQSVFFCQRLWSKFIQILCKMDFAKRGQTQSRKRSSHQARTTSYESQPPYKVTEEVQLPHVDFSRQIALSI